MRQRELEMAGPIGRSQGAMERSMKIPIVPSHGWMAAALMCLVVGAVLVHDPARSSLLSIPAAHSDAAGQQALSGLSTARREPLSGAIGAADRAYWITATAGGVNGVSSVARLHVSFGRTGAMLSSGTTRVGLRLRAAGYGGALDALGAAQPRVSANRVSYTRGGLREWYLNGPSGIEQGFTVARAPASNPAGPLTLSVALSGNAHAALGPGGQSVTLSRSGGPSLRYGALVASDARGRGLRSWLQLEGSAILLRVDTRGASYPLRIDPLIEQSSKLVAAEESGEGHFGYSVSLSSNGEEALVGAPREGGNIGAAWVFTRSGSTWAQQGELTGGEESGAARFGDSVALSGDGQTAVVGGPRDGLRGAAWVFTRSGGGWTQQGAKLTGSEENKSGHFGVSVALSSDGDTALIGGPTDVGGRGSAWVFSRSGGGWTQQGAKLTGGEEGIGEGFFGRSVALSGDGDTALIGAGGDGGYVGAAWVFTRSGATWTQMGKKLTDGEADEDGRFGYSVALSEDASTALVGGRSDGEVGAVWVFTRSAGEYVPQGEKLTGAGAHGDSEFGYSTSLSGDGEEALIGGPRDHGHIGAAWVFTRSGTTWKAQEPKLTGAEEAGHGWFGEAVALSSDGGTGLIGGSIDNARLGAAWTLQAEPEPPSQPPSTGGGGGGNGSSTSGSGTATGTSNVLGILAATLPAPVLGVTGNLYPISGTVLVKLPGSPIFILLSHALQVPFGTIVNAIHGKLAVTTARLHGGTQKMTFYAGEFKLTQNRNGLVVAKLTGGNFAVCPTARERSHIAKASSKHASGKHVVRKLWSEGHGSYSTQGNYASGAVLGTKWLTEDRCNGTLIFVSTDKVEVTNLVNHHRRKVKAGHSYLAKAPR
jgi:FG-GAP repeat